MRVVSHEGGRIRMVSHEGGLSPGWCLIRVVCHEGGLSSGGIS